MCADGHRCGPSPDVEYRRRSRATTAAPVVSVRLPSGCLHRASLVAPTLRRRDIRHRSPACARTAKETVAGDSWRAQSRHHAAGRTSLAQGITFPRLDLDEETLWFRL